MLNVRLEGGTYDGTQEDLDMRKPPNLLGAWQCPGCGDVHTAPYFEVRGQVDAEVVRYRFVRLDALGALYRYADLNLGDPGTIEAPVVEPEPDVIEVEPERELEPVLEPA